MKNIIRTPETHPLTWRLRDDKQPVWLDEYRSKNGYEGARKALTGLSPDEIVNQVKDAGLKGRGGAGFSTGLKWSLMPKDESMNIRYLLCNADEMEPGTYKDRLLMEQLPHLLVEGMLISAFALKAYRGYIFLRGEYIEAGRKSRGISISMLLPMTSSRLYPQSFSAAGLKNITSSFSLINTAPIIFCSRAGKKMPSAALSASVSFMITSASWRI